LFANLFSAFHEEDLKFHALMFFFKKACCKLAVLNKIFFTKGRIHQKRVTGKSAAHFTSVCLYYARVSGTLNGTQVAMLW